MAVRKEPEITAEDIERVLSKLKPRKIELSCEEIPEEYLLIPLSDMHFGLNSKHDYNALQREIADRILNRYEEILITLHGDYFHVDNLLNTTEKGTRIDEVDFDASIEDGFNFILPLLDLALENSRKVTLVYLKGNHAPSTDFVFVKALQKLYTQIKFDLKFDEYKHARLGPHSIFLHHGDKIKNPERLHQVITAKFSKEWGESQSRYLITGHFHHEKSLSFAGLTWYQLQSPSKPSSYDSTYGYDISESGQMLFEFTKYKRSAIFFV